MGGDWDAGLLLLGHLRMIQAEVGRALDANPRITHRGPGEIILQYSIDYEEKSSPDEPT